MAIPIEFSLSALAWLDANPHAATKLLGWLFALAEQPDRSHIDEQLRGYWPAAFRAVVPLEEDDGNLAVVYIRFSRSIKVLRIGP